MPLTSRVQMQQGWDVFLVIMAGGLCVIGFLLHYIQELEARNQELEARNGSLSLPPTDANGRYDQPPIITLKESEGFSFSLGSADVSGPFRLNLTQRVIPRMLEISEQYQVKVVEVIGHTDEVPLRGSLSNLDTALVPFLQGERDDVTASDNVGLGMARAVAVLKILREEPRLAGFSFVPYSAGPLVLRGDRLSDGSDRQPRQERRRIEISLRQLR